MKTPEGIYKIDSRMPAKAAFILRCIFPIRRMMTIHALRRGRLGRF